MPNSKMHSKLKKMFSSVQKAGAKPAPVKRSAIIGCFDECKPNLIKGWVIDNADISKQLEVLIIIDGVPVTKVKADKFRGDLLAEGFGDGKHGFEWSPPHAMFENKKYHIEVSEASTGVFLQGSPKSLIGHQEGSKKPAIDWNQLVGAEGSKQSQFPLLLTNASIDKHITSDQKRLVATILNSGLFDPVYYVNQLGKEVGVISALEHFLNMGAAQGLSPMFGFNSKDYRELNADIQELSDANSFVHYVLFGRAEKRYYNRTILKQDAALLRSSRYFDSDWYLSFAPSELGDFDPQGHFLTDGWRKDLPPNRDFDYKLYLNCYSDARESDKPPFLHYLMQDEGRISSSSNADLAVAAVLATDEFDPEFYRARYKGIIPNNISEALHYCCEGRRMLTDPNGSFNTEYYLRKYPDLDKASIIGLVHYCAHGRKEGREAVPDISKYIVPGERAWNSSKPTILVGCHEASRTGAPILGLRLVEQLSQHANVISWLGKKGELSTDFLANSTAVVTGQLAYVDAVMLVRELKKKYQLQVAVLNSVVTAVLGMHHALAEGRVPMVALIHEYADYVGKEVLDTLLNANRVVFPAHGVKDSADAVSTKVFRKPTTNAVVRHQGRCIPPAGDGSNVLTAGDILLRIGVHEGDEKPIIVLGCGWVQIRKGLEDFIEAARLCKRMFDRPVRFIWVGGGYHPDTDIGYSVWLKSQLLNYEMEEDVIFFNETEDLTPFFDLADVFFLSSKLDPFPNVAIDAVNACVPVVAFERATGFSEFIKAHPSVGVAVPYLDVPAAVNAIQEFVSGARTRPIKNAEIAQLFSFASYADFVWAECQVAITQQKAIEDESEVLIGTKLLDAEFFKSSFPGLHHGLRAQPAEYSYTAMWARGIQVAKSRVGFNDMVAEDKMPPSENIGSPFMTPLARVIRSTAVPLNTHKTIRVHPEGIDHEIAGTISAALHIHAYYVDALPELLRRLGLFGRRVSTFITTDSAEKEKAIKSMVEKLWLDCTILLEPNRGRDVGPFIMTLKNHLSRFEVVGHFHLKGTKQLETSDLRQWQEFLYDSLLGKSGEIAAAVLQSFEANPKLGLCFQEDPCLPSWGKNRAIADQLLQKLGISQQLPDAIEYPTGNMFWARAAALAPLMQYNWQWSDFPTEPIPYDGSILHALERLTPVICEAAGFEWATVHNTSARRYYHQVR